ncbi:MAG: sulfite exporter TauE/SafE family protein [Verrucomicrobiales bacterium]
MTEFADHLPLFCVLFFLAATAHSSVGLGGGSSYTAIMALSGLSTALIPSISLSLNLIATSIGAFHFIRHGHARWPLVLPFLVFSLPAAYLGGSLTLPRAIFYPLLLASLLLMAWQLLREATPASDSPRQFTSRQQLFISLFIGAVLGFLAGAVGIGGGIYLVPLIILLGLSGEKEAAACGAIFIWLNSAAGLLARSQDLRPEVSELLPLALAVILGSSLGSKLGASRLPVRSLQRILAGVLLLASLLLAHKTIKVLSLNSL